MLLENKTGIVLGVTNRFSIAWGIAKKIHDNGGKVILSYLNDKLKTKVAPLAKELDADMFELDVSDDNKVKEFFNSVKEKYTQIDFLVHSIAFANREDLAGEFYNTSKEGFLKAMEISAYSLIEVSRYAKELMKNGGSIVTLTYEGARKVIPSYNVMGVAKAALEANVRYLAWSLGDQNIRVNAISAGPINTLSARGIKGFTKLLEDSKHKNALKNYELNIEDVGNAAVFLVSNLSTAITGEILHVDAGINIMGV